MRFFRDLVRRYRGGFMALCALTAFVLITILPLASFYDHQIAWEVVWFVVFAWVLVLGSCWIAWMVKYRKQ